MSKSTNLSRLVERRYLVAGCSVALAVAGWLLLTTGSPEAQPQSIARTANVGVVPRAPIAAVSPAEPPVVRERPPEARPISGFVRSVDGPAVPGARVCLVGTLSREPLDCVNADQLGLFDVRAADGHTHLLINAAGYVPSTRSLDAAVAQADPRGVEIRLEPGGVQVSGTVLDGLGGEIAGALVTARPDATSPVWGATHTDADGRFTLQVPAVRLEVQATLEGYSRAAVAVLAPMKGVRLLLVPPSSISGSVLAEGTGAGLAGARIIARNLVSSSASERTAKSGEDGQFVIEDLPPGKYELLALAENWRSNPTRTSLGLGEGTEDVVLHARPATMLEGIVNAGSQPCPGGSAAVRGPVYQVEPIRANGAVRFEGLLPGSYQVTLSCLLDADRLTTLNGADYTNALGGEDVVEVGSAPLQRFWQLRALAEDELAQQSKVGTIRVSITPAAAADALTVLVKGVEPQALQGRRHGALVDFVVPVPNTYVTYLEQDPDTRLSVTVQNVGEVVEANLAAAIVTRVTGRVVDRNRMPVPDAWVQASGASPLGTSASIGLPNLSNERGEFALEVYGGMYDVTAIHPGGEARLVGVRGGDEGLLLELSPPRS